MNAPSLPLFSTSIIDLHGLYLYFYNVYLPNHEHLCIGYDAPTINFIYDQVVEASASMAISHLNKHVRFAPNVARDYNNAGLPVKDLSSIFVPRIRAILEDAGLVFIDSMVVKLLSAGSNLFIVRHTVATR